MPLSSVRVRVPATSANLGPAFDCAGLALSASDELRFTVLDEGRLEVQMSGEGADSLPRDESHLVVQAFRAACTELGWRPGGLGISADNRIPQGRGLGSSAAAVVAGVLAAWALCPDVGSVDRAAVLRLADRLEGHPDNVAACVLGGATLSWTAPTGARAERIDVHPGIRPVLLVPETTLATSRARSLLPDLVPHADAAYAAGRAALLVHALTRRPELLLEATDDRLHQHQRAPGMPDSLALLDRLREAGHAAVVSGAGPSLLVLAPEGAASTTDDVRSTVVADVRAHTPSGWRVLALEVDSAGAQVVPEPAGVSS